jgi:hypothetical protein
MVVIADWHRRAATGARHSQSVLRNPQCDAKRLKGGLGNDLSKTTG